MQIPLKIRNQDISTVSVFDPETEEELNTQLEKAITEITLPRLKAWQAANYLYTRIPGKPRNKEDYPTDLFFTVVLIYKMLFLCVNSALAIIVRVDLDGMAFDNSCSAFKRMFLFIEKLIILFLYICMYKKGKFIQY